MSSFPRALIGLAVLWASSAGAQSALAVTVVDDSTRSVVSGAVITVANEAARAVTDEAGVARLGVAAGLYVVHVEAEGYDPVTFTAAVGDEPLVGEVGVVPAAKPLGEVVATAERWRPALARAGFYDRREDGRGEHLDRDDFERRSLHQLSAALTGLSGVRLQRWDGRVVAVSSRNALTPDGGRSNRPCPLTVYKDGVRLGADETFDVSLVGTGDLAGIEVYAGPATVPPEFRQFAPCGVVLLWSRLE